MKHANANYQKVRVLEQLRRVDKADYLFLTAKLNCPNCDKRFGIEWDYIGIVTCPYCGEYVEG